MKVETAPDTSGMPSLTSKLDHIFRARKVAIVGASQNVGTARNTLVRVLQKHGFSGAIYPVNPKQGEIEGLTCYPDVLSLPDVPDVALVITPAETVPEIIAQCGEKKIPSAVVFSSGFEETDDGKELANELARVADESDVVVLGPNCQGVWSIRDKTMLTFGAAAAKLDHLVHAPIAIVSQSGALGGAIANYFQSNDIGCSYVISVGNETCVDILDCLRWTIEQDDVRVAVLYIEGLNDGGRILAIAERARELGVQIVAIKSGNSALGQAATASHTGKIASATSVYKHLLDQAGIILVDSLGEVFAAVETLAFFPNPRVSGDPKGGISVLSTSGGACALLADHSEQYDVPMAEFTPKYAEDLKQVLPAFARSANPVDLTGQIRANPTLIDDSVAIVTSDPRTEVLVMQLSSSGRRDINEKGHVFKNTAQATGMPTVISLAGETATEQERKDFRESGVMFAQEPSATVRALGWLYRRQQYAARPAPQRREPLTPRPAPKNWPETMAYLQECGIGQAKWTILQAGDTAAEACANISYPLVVKALPSEADHKTELGLVKLRVESAEAVDRHAADFRKIMKLPDAGILVQEMIGGEVEVVLSCLRKTDFGPVLNIGLGGMAIELFREVSHLALPADAEQVRNAMKKLKLWELLQGYRGKPRTDIEALIKAAVQLGDQFLATPEMDEFEINPLMVMREGQGVFAVDALVSISDDQA